MEQQQLTTEQQGDEPQRKAKILPGGYGAGSTLAEIKVLLKVIFKPHTFDGPTTSEVLGRTHADDPRTVYDKLRANPWIFGFYMFGRASFFMEPEVEMYSFHVREWRALLLRHSRFKSLPSTLSNAHHVYVVMSTEMSWHNVFLHQRHWSLYTHGCFFHLGISGNLESATSKASGAALKLNCEVFSEQAPTGFQKTGLPSSKKAFAAIEAGLTQYSVDEVRCLAEHVIRRIDKYHLYGANCHVFVVALMVRLIMGRRNSSIFVGTKDQIVDWDIQQHHTDQKVHTDSVETGFLVRDPQLQKAFFHAPPIASPTHHHTIQRINSLGRLYAEIYNGKGGS